MPEKLRNEAVKKALTGSPVTIFFVSADGLFEWIENAQSVWASEDLAGHAISEVFDDDALQLISGHLTSPPADKFGITAEVTTRKNGKARLANRILKITAQRHPSGVDGRDGLLCSSIDVTEDRARIETQRVLLLEVAHRSKNMLAMVLSVAAQTARATPDVSTFLRRFTGRVQSMAKSQDSITAADWKGVMWRDLVDQQVTKIVPLGSTRIVVEGNDVLLTPNASTHIGLALHELVTFSLANGGLSQRAGGVTITLDSTDDTLKMVWTERTTGSDAALEEVDRFAKTLLERIVPAAMSGSGCIQIDDGHLQYVLTVGTSDYTRL